MRRFQNNKNRSYLELKISDFGPISNGTITTKPLTILVGPNGCGKSHVATLVYTIGMAESIRFYDLFGTSDIEPIDFFYNEAKHIHKQLTMDSEQIIESDAYKEYVKYIVNIFYDMLSDTFLSEPKNLIRFGQNRFVLNITSDIINGNIQYSAENNQMKFKAQNLMQFKFVFDKHSIHPFEYEANGNIIKIHLSSPSVVDKQKLFSEIWTSMRHILRRLPQKRVIYFPAERGGLTMAQRSLTRHYYNMRRSTHGGSPDPNLPNVATDFLDALFMPTRRLSVFAKPASDFVTEALKGIITNKGGTNSIPDIIFKQNGREIPLNVSASSAKDIAAFILYLKHAAKPMDVLVLEEPEMCLHPNNQRMLARLLARLINAGIRLVVTTHSPYFLEQLSHCVMGSTIQNTKRKEVLTDDECIKIKDVAAYEFVPLTNSYEIRSLPITHDGIPQAEFTDVDDSLYNELVKLRQADE